MAFSTRFAACLIILLTITASGCDDGQTDTGSSTPPSTKIDPMNAPATAPAATQSTAS